MAIAVPEKRIAEFENFGFGVFIHWGLYSQLGKGEWIQHNQPIPKNEYIKLRDSFTAAKFDAYRIAHTARLAGAKYITLTTRHHDGFSLYDTCGLNKYDAPNAPLCRRDLIKEFTEGCRSEGIVPFFYHTTLDWYNEDFNNDFSKYLEYLRRSVEILCSNYGKIGGLWFDGNWSKPDSDWEEDKLYAVIRRHQPQAMIINNTGLGKRGETGHPEIDSVTFEQGRPTAINREGMPKYVAAEMCHTMNAHWGMGALDFNYKSLPHLIESLCACRKVGANYLLNVGPDGEGEIAKMQQALLDGIGAWIDACGNAIYKGKPCTITALGSDKNFALKDQNKYYLFIHDLSIVGDNNVTVEGGGSGPRSFTGMPANIKNIRWIDNNENLEFNADGDKLTINCTGYEYGKNLVVRVAEVTVD